MCVPPLLHGLAAQALLVMLLLCSLPYITFLITRVPLQADLYHKVFWGGTHPSNSLKRQPACFKLPQDARGWDADMHLKPDWRGGVES